MFCPLIYRKHYLKYKNKNRFKTSLKKTMLNFPIFCPYGFFFLTYMIICRLVATYSQTYFFLEATIGPKLLLCFLCFTNCQLLHNHPYNEAFLVHASIPNSAAVRLEEMISRQNILTMTKTSSHLCKHELWETLGL